MRLHRLFTLGALILSACGSEQGSTADNEGNGQGYTQVDGGAGAGGAAGAAGAGGAAGKATGGAAGEAGNSGAAGASGDAGSSGAAGAAGAAPDAGPPPCESDLIVGEGKPLAKVGSCGKLEYRTYPAQGESKSVHRLPDFSFAGYQRGGVAIPVVAVKKTISPVAGDDRANIQAAIDEVSQMPQDGEGFRGAVLLQKGTYELNDTLYIKATGVVLRGEGQGTGGTVLKATAAKQYDLIEAQGSGSGWGEVSGSRRGITSSYVPVGARSFEIDSASGYAAGDSIIVVRKPNQAWIDDLGMAQFGWTPSAYAIEHERKVVAVNGNTLTIDIPIVDAMQDKYGGGEVALSKVSGRIARVGIEDLQLESAYASETDEAHGRTAVLLTRVTSSWVRRVTAKHFWYSAVSVDGESSFITVQDTAHVDPKSEVTGGRRYSFNVSQGMGVLFQRCYARDSRHDFVTASRVTGPNVWLDCLAADSNADDGPHHRWATGLLFDNVKGEQLRVQNRAESGSGHGWAGAQTLFWNSQANELVCDAPRGAMNWAIGCVGTKSEGQWTPEEPAGWWESEGKNVSPRSLYLQQLEDRLGSDAVKAVTVPEQRTGKIWDALSSWAGNGKLEGFLN